MVTAGSLVGIDIERLKYPVEPRISQILLPLANLSSDEQILEKINNLAKKMHQEQIENRSTTKAAVVLQVIKDIEDSREKKREKIYLTEIVEKVSNVIFGDNEKKKVSSQFISNVLRSPELMIKIEPKDRNGRSIYFKPEIFEPLFKKYGITEIDESENSENVTSEDCDE